MFNLKKSLCRPQRIACGAGLWWASAAAMGATLTGTFLDAAKVPVNDAVIYAMPVSGAGVKPSRGANVEQINKAFVPHVTPVAKRDRW